MSDSEAFEWTCAELETKSTLDKLEARGTVRLALKQAGLEARSTTGAQMAVVVAKVLPGELRTRGVEDADSICASLETGLKAMDSSEAGDSPEAIFKRLGG